MNIIKKINKVNNIWEILPKLTQEDLEEVIIVSSDSYYNSGKSLIDDLTFDILIDKLRKLNPNSPVLFNTGAPIKGKKVKLPFWMGSMDKIKSDEKAINKWTKTYNGPYIVSDKLDGISCLLTKTDNKLKMYTRGDGTYGQDISHLLNYVNIKTNNILTVKNDLALRGELIMTKTNFEKYENEMANARAMVGGIVNSKKESINKTHAKDVDIIFYEIIDPVLKPIKQYNQLIKWKLPTVFFDVYETLSVDILDDVLSKRKKKSEYEIDGLIITDNNKHVRNESGNPPYSFAYKGLTPTADVKVLDVYWKPSKDGILVPRIHFEKVRLSQADLKFTTGFNAKYIVDNGIGPEAIITVIRSGDVIPYIIGVVKSVEPSLPDVDYVWDKNGVNIVLKNASSNETVIIQRLTKFIKLIGVENMSEGIITRLVEAGYNTIEKIINLTIEDMLEIEGFQDKLATKLYNNLQNSLENLDVLTLMDASNFFGRGFGIKKLKKILDIYPNISIEYKSNDRKVWENKLVNIEGFDIITVDKFLDKLPKFQKFYNSLKKQINIKPYVNTNKKKGIFTGENVVFTGFRNVSWQKFVEKEGGKVSSSVSKNTTLLVYNDGEESSAKYLKAKQLGIKTMSKTAFSKKFEI
ncbi:DNA ligase [Cotonvirus japonicus]|uniref:DNA ligase (NAD(+)) n=1 Tax=Cotonvirus japonicus TaxID=2811091 RepID=A0ABM7NSY5_9VIRU|nr:DNA ligase [Cotonvirus japonicus]BCS83288.1 DNA ligase [Cotonvirus japonicus]